MSPIEGWGYWIAAICYALSFGAGLYAVIFRKTRFQRPSLLLFFLGAVSHLVAFLARTSIVGHIPTIGNYENILTGSLFIVILAVVLLRQPKRFPGLLGTIPLVLLLMGFAVVSDPSPRPFIASLQSSWLYIHIFFAWLAYAAFTVAAGVAIAYLVQLRKGKTNEAFDELMFRLTAFGLIADAIMIAAGSIWAKDLWGSYWSWDPVETWSLLSFLIYGLVLHLRITLGIRGKRIAWLLILSLVTVLVSFWGVNFAMQSSEHIFNVG